MKDIPEYSSFSFIKSINAGLSTDQKYYIETSNSQKLLLRVADISKYDQKNTEFIMMKRIIEVGVPMPEPISFGVCNDGKSVYILLTWCNGQDVEKLLSTYSNNEKYALGIKSGKILRKIHSIYSSEQLNDWQLRYFDIINNRLTAYHKCGIRFEGADLILDYVNNNKHILKNRPQCFLHGDYHAGNLIFDEDKNVMHVIDWNHADFDNWGDPWTELANVSTEHLCFSVGQINGYFDGNVPPEFWSLFELYIAVGAITAIPWASNYGQEMIKSKLKMCHDVLGWFNNMNNSIPIWYNKAFYTK